MLFLLCLIQIFVSFFPQIHEPSIPADLLQTQSSSGLELTSLCYGTHPTLFIGTNNGTFSSVKELDTSIHLSISVFRFDNNMGHNRK